MIIRPTTLELLVPLLRGLHQSMAPHQRMERDFDTVRDQYIFDVRHNPILAHSAVQMLVAREGSEVLGLILVGVNRKIEPLHAYFVLLEAKDATTAEALLEEAETWARNRQQPWIEGPLLLSTWLRPGRTLPLSIGERADTVGKTLFKRKFEMVHNHPILEVPCHRANEPASLSPEFQLKPLQIDQELLPWLQTHRADIFAPDLAPEAITLGSLAFLFRHFAKHFDPRFLVGLWKGKVLCGLAICLADQFHPLPTGQHPLWRDSEKSLPKPKQLPQIQDLHLYMVGILPEFRRQGLGSHLFSTVMNEAKKAGIRRIVGPRISSDLEWALPKLQEAYGAEPVMGYYWFKKALEPPVIPPQPPEPPPFLEMGKS